MIVVGRWFGNIKFCFIYLSWTKWRTGHNPQIVGLHNSIMKLNNSIFNHQDGIILKSATCPLRSRVLRLTETSSLRPDSPRTSPRNETVKLSRRQMIVASYSMEWLSGTWCRTWWYHSSQTAMKVGLTLAQRRDDVADVGQTFGQPTLLSGMTQSFKISVIMHSFVRALLWCIDITPFRVFQITLLVFGWSPSESTERHPPRPLTVGQLLYLWDCRWTGRATQKDAKAKF